MKLVRTGMNNEAFGHFGCFTRLLDPSRRSDDDGLRLSTQPGTRIHGIDSAHVPKPDDVILQKRREIG